MVEESDPQQRGASGETAGAPEGASKDAKNLAMLAHLLGIFTSFIAPLIIWLIKKDDDAFIEDQGKEALNFQITVAIAMFVSSLAVVIFIGFLLVPAVMIANLVFCILAAVRSSKGEKYRYPVALRLVQ